MKFKWCNKRGLGKVSSHAQTLLKEVFDWECTRDTIIERILINLQEESSEDEDLCNPESDYSGSEKCAS